MRITTENEMVLCGCRSAGECNHNTFAELSALNKMVDAFAAEMKTKLKRKFLEGKAGWDDPAWEAQIERALQEHVHKGQGRTTQGQEIDIANLAAMLWNLRR